MVNFENGNIYFKDNLEKVSRVLGISVDEVVERYIRRGLYLDDFFVQPIYTSEELREFSKIDAERRKKEVLITKET